MVKQRDTPLLIEGKDDEMANQTSRLIEEVLVSPLEEIISRVGQGIAEAQRNLDLHSVALQTMIENDPALKEHGLEATWYHMPETEVELKLALNFKREDIRKNGKLVVRKHRMYGAPMNAVYKNTFNADVSGSSKLRLKIVSIPPPGRIGE